MESAHKSKTDEFNKEKPQRTYVVLHNCVGHMLVNCYRHHRQGEMGDDRATRIEGLGTHIVYLEPAITEHVAVERDALVSY